MQTTALTHRHNANASARSRSAKPVSNGRVGRRCVYCGKRLPANSKAIYCSASHRVSMSRYKKRMAAALLETVYGMPGRIAVELLARYGLPEVEEKLAALGWVWRAPDREWTRERNAYTEAGAA